MEPTKCSLSDHQREILMNNYKTLTFKMLGIRMGCSTTKVVYNFKLLGLKKKDAGSTPQQKKVAPITPEGMFNVEEEMKFYKW